MARTVVTPITLDRVTGAQVHAASGSWTTADVSDGNQFLNDGKTFLVAINTHAATARNVTVSLQPTATMTTDGATVTSPAVSVTAQTIRILGPFPTDTYNDVNGYAYVDGATTDLKFIVIAL